MGANIRQIQVMRASEIEQKTAWAADAIFKLCLESDEEWNFPEWLVQTLDTMRISSRPECSLVAELAWLGYLVSLASMDEDWQPREDWPDS